MPRKPKKPCGYPGCPNLTEEAYCEEHKRIRDKQYNKYKRDDFTKNFYTSKEWKIVRSKHLKLHPLCEECYKNGKLSKAAIVDHIIPIKQGGSKYDEENLQSLCWSCHSRKSIKEGSRFGKN